MIRLAFVGEHYGAQVRANPKELSGVDVVWCGDRLGTLEPEARAVRPDVVVVGLAELGDDPRAGVRRLLEATGVKLAVVVYAFARRDLVTDLAATPGVRVVQGPLSLSNLRCQMLDLIVGDILRAEPRAGAGSGSAPGAEVDCPTCGTPVAPGRIRRARAIMKEGA